ncbi:MULTISPECIES: TetR/AcrR family transcriptional regulator [unclassified Vibrio]|uniref:TetR/AcrR family transcriptional regulator n=1 Tax=unclassified Vibrio TaxID=2614977 RepID=UPI001361304C|nr:MULTISPECIES: TetR/AcrR family transcriptional regulator [unclassified Vibrio]NAW57441.1 TetR family transcriptional regulator [Vibrio sp. V36_P2S2PM302]NAX27128.1 TetR family transcriptional regulator [Vibrio sp. V38_P2S17PM301]NAX28861.1 TetR family transcriptional regulator [Vibrio sp. V37_P2S8PM304]
MVKRSDIKQDDIIKSAIEVFSQKGFEQASMEGISKQAGVSKRTLYKYYPNKDALFEVIVDKLICRFDDQKALQFEPSVSVAKQLQTLTQQQLCYINTEDFQMTARMVMAECIRCPHTSRLLMEKFAAIEDSYGLTVWVKQGVAAGVLEVENVSQAVEQYIGSIKASVFWPQLLAHQPPPSCEQVNAAIETAVRCFVACYVK